SQSQHRTSIFKSSFQIIYSTVFCFSVLDDDQVPGASARWSMLIRSLKNSILRTRGCSTT
ncbi:hypothetical protein LINGRAHAP2_LOCUS293, partial [Linum grandiflorum]